MRTAVQFVLLSLVAAAATSASAGDTVVDITVGGRRISGLVVAHNAREVHLVTADGSLESFGMGQVKSFRKSGARLRVDNAVRVKAALMREFGRDYEVVTSTRYVVVAPRGRAKQYLQTFDGIARSFTSYFGKRRIPLRESRFPLVAIVFRTQAEFAEYARKDGVGSVANVAGYYLRTSNRVAAYESGQLARRGPSRLSTLGGDFRISDDAAFTVDGDLRETLIHEATHQLAFNTGLHHRAGVNPKWVVEGLATLFEPDSVRKRVVGGRPGDRVNPGRLRYAQRLGLKKWSTSTVSDIVSSDRMFESDAGGAYSLAWSLSFYLNERRPRDYARYLATLKARDPLADYSPDERLKDFRLVFGRDLARFDADFRRFMQTLPAS